MTSPYPGRDEQDGDRDWQSLCVVLLVVSAASIVMFVAISLAASVLFFNVSPTTEGMP